MKANVEQHDRVSTKLKFLGASARMVASLRMVSHWLPKGRNVPGGLPDLPQQPALSNWTELI